MNKVPVIIVSVDLPFRKSKRVTKLKSRFVSVTGLPRHC